MVDESLLRGYKMTTHRNDSKVKDRFKIYQQDFEVKVNKMNNHLDTHLGKISSSPKREHHHKFPREHIHEQEKQIVKSLNQNLRPSRYDKSDDQSDSFEPKAVTELTLASGQGVSFHNVNNLSFMNAKRQESFDTQV